MGQKGHIIVQKGLKMHEKRQKIEFLDLKNLLCSGIFLSGIGGYPPPPLTENHPAQKPLAEMGRPLQQTDMLASAPLLCFKFRFWAPKWKLRCWRAPPASQEGITFLHHCACGQHHQGQVRERACLYWFFPRKSNSNPICGFYCSRRRSSPIERGHNYGKSFPVFSESFFWTCFGLVMYIWELMGVTEKFAFQM